MRTLRVFGAVTLVALTMGFVGYLVILTEPVLAPVSPSPTATRSGGFGPVPATFPADGPDFPTCERFDSWIWAQTTFELDPAQLEAALDDDGNGLACEALPVNAFAPVLWATSLPAGVQAARVVRVVDGDTIVVQFEGRTETVRFKAIDAPEVEHRGGVGDPPECGGVEATAFLQSMIDAAPDGVVHFQFEGEERDRYGRLLAYAWMEIEGRVYLLQEGMIRNGWAMATTYASDRLYREEMAAAEQFSIEHVLGVPLLCGAFGQPPDATPDPEMVALARQRQPDQGQLEDLVPDA